MIGSRARYTLLCALLFLCSAMLFGQAETGLITGTVVDVSGAVVGGATVTVTDVNTGAQRTATTNNDGSYTVSNLKPSMYEVVIDKQGFTKYTRRIAVTVGSRNELSAQMSVMGGGTTVEVTAESGGAAVNTETQTLSSVVSGAQITELPTLTRNPYDLVATAGNVTEDTTGTMRGAGFSINGQRSASTDVLLDGGENVDMFTASVGQQVPLDSVQEFRVVTSNFTAEYGRAGGGVLNVATKSGANAFHGTAYEFNRISALAANTWENDTNDIPKSTFTRNQFGYSVGGPIIKNKLFFFSNTEWIRVRSSSNQIVSIIDPAMFPNLAPNSVAALSYADVRSNATLLGSTSCAADALCSPLLASNGGPLPNGSPFTQQLSYTAPAEAGGGLPENTWMTVNRFDYNMTDKTTFFGRYAGYHEEDFNGTVNSSPYSEGFDTGQNIFNNNVLINMTHVFTPNIVSQSKFDFNRLNLLQPLGTQPVGPTMYVSSQGVPTSGGYSLIFPGYSEFTPGNSIPFGGPQNLYQFFQDVSWTKGRHQLRFGGQYIHIRDNRTFGAYENAVQYLSTGAPVTAGGNTYRGNTAGIYNLVAGNIANMQVAVDPRGAFPGDNISLPAGAPSFSRNNRFNDGAFYLQDSWKVTSRLTLNYGVRWEYYGVQHNADPSLDSNFYEGSGATLPIQVENGTVQIANQSPVGSLWEPSKHNWGPRLGFAWDVFGDGKTAIRGGWGMSYERNFGNVTFNVIQNPPNYAVLNAVNTPVTLDNFGPLSGSSGSVVLPPTTLRAVQPNIDNAYTEFRSLSLEREVLKNSLVAFEYSGSNGVHLYDIGNTNVFFPGYAGYGDYFDPATYHSGVACYPGCRLNQQYSNINSRGSRGFSRYNGLNTRFTTNNLFNKGLQLNFNWTWSHSIDNLSSTFSEGNNGAFQLGYENYYAPQLDTGNSEFDVRHRIAVSAVWDLPWMKNASNAFVRQALGGWSFSPLITYHTGYPFSVYDCTNGISQCPRYLPTGGERDGFANSSTYAGGGVFNYLNAGSLVAAPGFGMPGVGGSSQVPEAPCQGAIGCNWAVGPRNMYTGPGNHQFNAVIGKTFKLTERFNLQFRGEMYNVFNNHNYFLLTSNADVSSGALGSPFFVQAVKGGFGNPTDERRNVQFGLKLIF
ncbi:TonB-dependent receptor [Candidatus Koribacter versatilis Ellin345]|uniref:TonB-dependent receptor n=1 Tax=Koribacter versatilis (strain Ellin345) TaxID=204669 RepID=Q1IJQ5_KORVE|nr:TonB-dependent receptor [Candidatus Koribacter versatilis Ellin345]